MSLVGQKAKYSLGADVFRFGPNNGYRSIGSACPFGATSRRVALTGKRFCRPGHGPQERHALRGSP
jgi:hypothetical protein